MITVTDVVAVGAAGGGGGDERRGDALQTSCQWLRWSEPFWTTGSAYRPYFGPGRVPRDSSSQHPEAKCDFPKPR